MVTGLGPRDADRLALASKFGADLAVDVAVDDPVAALTKATGTMADVVVYITVRAPATTGGCPRRVPDVDEQLQRMCIAGRAAVCDLADQSAFRVAWIRAAADRHRIV